MNLNERLRDGRRDLVGMDAFVVARIHRSHDIVVGLAALDIGITVLSHRNQRRIQQRVGPARDCGPIHVVPHDRGRTGNPR